MIFLGMSAFPPKLTTIKFVFGDWAYKEVLVIAAFSGWFVHLWDEGENLRIKVKIK
jgi:hypothetical protein